MKVTAESLYERYSAVNTEALSDLYHDGELTDLAVSVLEKVIASRGLDWTDFTTSSPTELKSISDWELWKSKSGRLPSDARKQDDVETHRTVTTKNWKQQVAVIVLIVILGTGLFWMLLPLADPAAGPMDILRPWLPPIIFAAVLLEIAMEAMTNSICPACRRWFAFKKKGEKRTSPNENKQEKEGERVCKHCGHQA